MEFEAVFREANQALQLAMLLAREAGLRRAAILELTPANCNFETRTIVGRTKGLGRYNVPMTQRVYERLLWACAGADGQNTVLVRSPKRLVGYSYNYLPQALHDAQRRAGVEPKWGMHDLRRTGARALYAATKDLRKVQRYLSHAHPLNTLWYLGNAGIDLSPADLEAISTHQEDRREKTA